MMPRAAAPGPAPVDRHPNSLSSFSTQRSRSSSTIPNPSVPTSSQSRQQILQSKSGNGNSFGALSNSNLRSLPAPSTTEPLSTGSRKAKPPLGIYIPSLTTSGSYYLPGLTAGSKKTPVKRKPVPGSASTVGDDRPSPRNPSARSSVVNTRNSSNNGVLFPPRKSSLNSPARSPGHQSRSASIATPGHPNLLGVELVFRDLDKYVSCRHSESMLT
jgi:hypothetical protein